jgi:hypothetical protein
MIAAALALLATQAAFANPDEVEQEELSPQALCESYAREDGVIEEDYAGYMQDCIASFEEMPAEGAETESMLEETGSSQY